MPPHPGDDHAKPEPAPLEPTGGKGEDGVQSGGASGPGEIPGSGEGSAIDALGLTRVTFARDGHRYEFRCERGEEAALARAVLELGRRADSPLEAGDAFVLCRQIESLGGVESSSSGLPAGSRGGRKKAA